MSDRAKPTTTAHEINHEAYPTAEPADRAQSIFGNPIPARAYAKACRSKQRYIRKFGDDSNVAYHLGIRDLPVIGERLGVRDLVVAGAGDGVPALELPAQPAPVIVGNIRMGFGHYRISMAMASAAHALGYAPYWLDLSGLEGTTCAKVIGHQNDLYSLGSRLSQRIGLFNRLVWEPMNTEGFRKITYNASDQKNAELMAAPLRDLPRDVPYIGTHAWPAQAAVHAGLTHVVEAIPDNWPMALHLAEGAIHTVQTPSAYLGYRTLAGMDGKHVLHPMPPEAIACTGHYVDHELVSNIETDCAARRTRLVGDGGTSAGGPVRYLLSVGGAGAQGELFAAIIEHVLPYVKRDEAVLLINVGDHRDVWDMLVRRVPELGDHGKNGEHGLVTEHFNDFAEVARFCDTALADPLGGATGVHAFCDTDIFSAVYSTNLLMRCCDALLTKPSELAYYPVPKLLIRRVGGHEAWGAIRSAEMGDGTYELDTPEEICSMIDTVQANRDILTRMCDAIERNKAAGIYDGAYQVVRIAVAGSIEGAITAGARLL